MKNRVVYFLPAIICFILSFYLLTIPGNELPEISFFDKYHLDKPVHIIMFFALGCLFSFPLKSSFKKYHWLGFIAITGVVYGILMEFVQKYFIPFRSFDVDDMVADAIGSSLAWFWWRKKFFKNQYLNKKIGPDKNRGRNQN